VVKIETPISPLESFFSSYSSASVLFTPSSTIFFASLLFAVLVDHRVLGWEGWKKPPNKQGSR